MEHAGKTLGLAGKTGTAELKATKEDTSGTEIGWFTVFTTDRDTKRSYFAHQYGRECERYWRKRLCGGKG